jgi:predicted anti-sigma-YlaC factor YlaD
MLTCRDVTELVTDYLEGRQAFFDRMRFELHLGMCRHCRAYLRQMRVTIETLRKLSEGSIPPEIMQRLLARFRAWKA